MCKCDFCLVDYNCIIILQVQPCLCVMIKVMIFSFFCTINSPVYVYWKQQTNRRVCWIILNYENNFSCMLLNLYLTRAYNTAYSTSQTEDHITLNTNTSLQKTSSPDITMVSNTLYNRTSWTTQHALSSDHLHIITTINIRHDYRLQQNRRTFTNYKKADWTQFTEATVCIPS